MAAVVLLNWSLLRGADAVVSGAEVGTVVYRVSLHAALVLSLVGIALVAWRLPPQRSRAALLGLAIAFAGLSLGWGALGVLVVFFLGA